MSLIPLSPQVLIALVIEAALLLSAGLLLGWTGVSSNLAPPGSRWSGPARLVGYVLLCLTFCWSVVLGSVLTLNAQFFAS